MQSPIRSRILESVVRLIDLRIDINNQLGSTEEYGGHGEEFHSACVAELMHLREMILEDMEDN